MPHIVLQPSIGWESRCAVRVIIVILAMVQWVLILVFVWFGLNWFWRYSIVLRVMPIKVSQPNNTVFICSSPLDSVVGLARWVSMVFGGFSVWCLLVGTLGKKFSCVSCWELVLLLRVCCCGWFICGAGFGFVGGAFEA